MKIETRHDPDGFWSAIDADNYEAESDSEGLVEQVTGRAMARPNSRPFAIYSIRPKRKSRNASVLDVLIPVI